MIFWRIIDDTLLWIAEVSKLGFDVNNEDVYYVIPEEYIEKGEFVIMRTCHGVGDWGILTAMARILKNKYPHCKVYLPSVKLLEKLFLPMKNNWSTWTNPFDNQNLVFKNNPYIDGTLDSVSGEIYHDHFRIFDSNNSLVPLVVQMLKFWRIDDTSFSDARPELYFSQEEIDKGEKFIEDRFGGSDFGVLVISHHHNYEDKKNKEYQEYIDQYKDIPFMYYNALNEDIKYKFNRFLDIKTIKWGNIREQLYVTTKAKAAFSTQSGMTDTISRYTKVYSYSLGPDVAENFIYGSTYIT